MKLKLMWLVSLTAMLGSLYFSEIKNFIPCELCWYQRILMYPFVLIGGIAILKNDKKIVTYIMPLSIIGMCVSTYHYLKQKVMWFNDVTGTCNVGVPCNAQYINWFGFVTIPFLALIAFSIITIISVLIIKDTKKSEQ